MYTEIINGVEMALVPAGCFELGSDEGSLDELPPNEEICLDPFWIDVTEVTNAQYGSTGQFDEPQSPRESVTWWDAREHCRTRGARLPTEIEWEYAASGPDNLVYTWGNLLDFDNVVFRENRPQPVDNTSISVPPSWIGTYNMLGNVREWTNSIYTNSYDRPSQDDEDAPRSVRGGAYNLTRIETTYERHAVDPNDEQHSIGFRCAMDYDSDQ